MQEEFGGERGAKEATAAREEMGWSLKGGLKQVLSLPSSSLFPCVLFSIMNSRDIRIIGILNCVTLSKFTRKGRTRTRKRSRTIIFNAPSKQNGGGIFFPLSLLL